MNDALDKVEEWRELVDVEDAPLLDDVVELGDELAALVLSLLPVTCGECEHLKSGTHGISPWAYCNNSDGPLWSSHLDPEGYPDWGCSLGKRKVGE